MEERKGEQGGEMADSISSLHSMACREEMFYGLLASSGVQQWLKTFRPGMDGIPVTVIAAREDAKRHGGT